MRAFNLLKTLQKWALIVSVLPLSGCLEKADQSRELLEYQGQYPKAQLAQARFMMDSIGTLSLGSLAATNILPMKVYGTALLIVDHEETGFAIDSARLPSIMRKYGFLTPKRLENWRADWAPEPKVKTNLGFIHSDMKRDLNLGGKTLTSVQVEVANITCAACHSGTTYDKDGMPTGNAWLGSPNTSLNFDGFLNDIFKGLKIAAKDRRAFMATIKRAYPNMSKLEEKTISTYLMRVLAMQIKKFAKMDRVLPFPNGGPGLTNGVGAFKRDAKLLRNEFVFNPHESGFVSIPDISYRGFRSSLTYDGAYVIQGQKRFRRIDAAEAQDKKHWIDLSKLASFFTYSAMGNLAQNIEPNMPNVENIFDFLGELRPPPFPGAIDQGLALNGSKVFAKACASCHGTYDGNISRPELASFPNLLIPQEKMGTDPMRWQTVDDSIKKFSDRNIFGKYVDAGASLGGYTPPILSGIWATAPYLHNGSVPTLWHFLHPEARPKRFQLGGHAIDLQKVGIRGELKANGDYMYLAGYQPWSRSQMYDTRAGGHSSRGHEAQVQGLSEAEKTSLLEYLKLL